MAVFNLQLLLGHTMVEPQTCSQVLGSDSSVSLVSCSGFEKVSLESHSSLFFDALFGSIYQSIQNWGIQTTRIYFSVVQQARNPNKTVVPQNKEQNFLSHLAPGTHWRHLTADAYSPSLLVFSWSFYFHVCILLLQDIPDVLQQGPPSWYILTWQHLQ